MDYIETMKRRFTEADQATIETQIEGAVVIQTQRTPTRIYFLATMLHKTAAADLDTYVGKAGDLEQSIRVAKGELYYQLTYNPPFRGELSSRVSSNRADTTTQPRTEQE